MVKELDGIASDDKFSKLILILFLDLFVKVSGTKITHSQLINDDRFWCATFFNKFKINECKRIFCIIYHRNSIL